MAPPRNQLGLNNQPRAVCESAQIRESSQSPNLEWLKEQLDIFAPDDENHVVHRPIERINPDLVRVDLPKIDSREEILTHSLNLTFGSLPNQFVDTFTQRGTSSRTPQSPDPDDLVSHRKPPSWRRP